MGGHGRCDLPEYAGSLKEVPLGPRRPDVPIMGDVNQACPSHQETETTLNVREAKTLRRILDLLAVQFIGGETDAEGI